MNSFRISTIAEKSMEASKWLDVQALLSKNELAALFQYLEEVHGHFYLFGCGVVCPNEKGEIAKNEFLEAYGSYIDCLKNGQIPDLILYRAVFSPALTLSTDELFTIPVGEDRHIIRVARPVVQVQAHNMSYSTADKKFHPMVFGNDNIAWGLQFSYPQLFKDHSTQQVETIRNNPNFPNTALFHSLQKWMRQHTIPTPFVAEGNAVNVPMRLGKECLSWINSHPQLLKKSIVVKGTYDKDQDTQDKRH